MRHYLLLVLVLSLLACNNIEQEIRHAEAEVIRLHDVETMPKMGQLYSLSKKLGSIKDSISNSSDSLMIPKIELTIKGLKKAEDDMMTWMKSYGDSIQHIDTKSAPEKLAFYKGEITKMEDLKSLMFSSIEAAQNILVTVKE